MKVQMIGHGHTHDLWKAALIGVGHDLQSSPELIWYCDDALTAPFRSPGWPTVPCLHSCQVPVGTTAHWQAATGTPLVYVPENFRYNSTVHDALHPDRIVIGGSDPIALGLVARLLAPFNCPLLFMSWESAEMTKHAINAFMALEIAFINEIATVAKHVGADATDIERGLKSDARIGDKAYLRPGAAFDSPSLLRDLRYLEQRPGPEASPILHAIIPSNNLHAMRTAHAEPTP